MKSMDSGSNRPRVLWLADASSGIGRKSPIRTQPGNGNFQHKSETDVSGHESLQDEVIPCVVIAILQGYAS
jgi:hypothetical protein